MMADETGGPMPLEKQIDQEMKSFLDRMAARVDEWVEPFKIEKVVGNKFISENIKFHYSTDKFVFEKVEAEYFHPLDLFKWIKYLDKEKEDSLLKYKGKRYLVTNTLFVERQFSIDGDNQRAKKEFGRLRDAWTRHEFDMTMENKNRQDLLDLYKMQKD